MKKIFCIGFHKTGTKSLAAALSVLGYSVTGPNGVNDELVGENIDDLIRTLVPKYDAFQDNPWPIVFKKLDSWYPDSKFILTVRDTKRWYQSVLTHFGEKETPMRKWIYGEGYGAPSGNEDVYVQRYRDHIKSVKEHFTGRSKDIVVMNFSKGDGWEKLCKFLDKPVPNVPFPHRNKGSDRGGSR